MSVENVDTRGSLLQRLAAALDVGQKPSRTVLNGRIISGGSKNVYVPFSSLTPKYAFPWTPQRRHAGKPTGAYSWSKPHCATRSRLRRLRQAAYGHIDPNTFRSWDDYRQARDGYLSLLASLTKSNISR